ncbi:UDP binding domain-containing protein [Streptomyces heilongjiangensis]|uniref:UDP binding domain-containing protein n=1 Tax=Streptomyces heilongjiangensis TaxID=945052 RepID=A0ABW1BET7_9ACTN|nr:UDP binding domain-containing protein [Streptomyces heilongjiangensis]MDC2950188.1 UDP binding domain-containing protein [Streptomyces heilongjiangensis]
MTAGRERPSDTRFGGLSTPCSELVTGRRASCVWGLGYIGWSTVEALRAEDIRVLGYDVSTERVAALRHSEGPGLKVTDGREQALTDDIAVHFVCVPTERQAEPYSDALLDVFTSICRATAARPRSGTPPLVIIESTLTPGTVEQLLLPVAVDAGLVLGRDLLLALAPRRDWFLAEGYGLRDLDRVYGGVNDASATAAYEVLSLMCNTLHRARGHLEAELVKCVENSYRHLEITLANQLTLGYPHVDMVEVLRLAGTKWNIGTYHPSFGTGGYCIPLSSRYLLRGAAHPEELSLLSQAVETDTRMRSLVAESVADGPVVILGLAYKGGIKVATLSPTIRIAEELTRLGVPFSVHDPMYTDEEIEALLGAGTAAPDLATAIRGAATVLIVPDHPEFRGEPFLGLLTEERKSPLLILDNHGVLADHPSWPERVTYRRAGNPLWLDTPTANAPAEKDLV